MEKKPNLKPVDEFTHRGVPLQKILEDHRDWINHRNGTRADLAEAKLARADLRGANLQGASLRRADLRGADLQGVNLTDVDLHEAKVSRANLKNAILVGADLRKAVLHKAILQEATALRTNLQEGDLSEANLQGVDLLRANLKRANLKRARLRDASLTEAVLHESDLQDADLTDATGLLAGQPAGANVSGAKLPPAIEKFEEGLKVVEEASRNARKLFFGMLAACAYALLTIGTTTDVLLLTNSRSSPLPIIGTEIPIVWFYIAGPPVLLGLYFYFHLCLQRLWEGLAKLPAVFPDGRSLDEKAYPWLLIGLVRAHLYKLSETRPPLSHLQEWISIALAWGFMPLTLICFWFRYLPRQDWLGTGLHIVLFVVAAWAGIMFYRLAVGTLRGDESELSLWKKPLKEIRTYKRVTATVRVGLIVLLLSLGTINGTGWKFEWGDARTWVPYALGRVGLSPFANFIEMDVSTKPSDWSGEEVSQVKGAPLKGRNLRYARADGAFMVNADLRRADLREAVLKGVNLRGARLEGANLQKAHLEDASLQEADLRQADLKEANLVGANLQKAILKGADLQGSNIGGRANLKEADLWGANLKGALLGEANLWGLRLGGVNLREAYLGDASLQEADLRQADLRGALALTVEQLSKVKTLHGAKLDPELEKQIRENYPQLLEVPKSDE